MMLPVFFVLLISACWAQQEESAVQRPSRAPQGHIQYSDPDGLKVNWKLYAPYSQWKSHLENPGRSERAESGTGQPQLRADAELIQPAAASTAPAVAAPEDKNAAQDRQFQVQYQPYHMVPTHIKQLMSDMYEPQGVYVDPAVYIYRATPDEDEPKQADVAAEQEQESAQASSHLAPLRSDQVRYEQVPKYATKYPLNKAKLGYIQYKEEQQHPSAEESAAAQYGSVPERKEFAHYAAVPERKESTGEEQQQQQSQKDAEDSMPKELHQLLNLQAQTPYHVIANRIYYKPKTLFVPKPFSDEVKGPYKYRSKVYYVKNDEEQPKERSEREEPQQSEQQQQE